MTYVGIDIHRSTSTFRWSCPSTGAEGKRCIDTTAKEYEKLFAALPRPWIVAYEATRQAPMVTRLLRGLGCDELRLVHPRKLEALLALEKANTDVKAANEIMQLLMGDPSRFPEAYLAPVEVEEKREISRGYQYLRRIGTGLQNYLRSLLNKAGVDFKGTRILSKKGRERLPELIAQLEPFAQIMAAMLWDLLQLVDGHCEALKKLMKQELMEHPAGIPILKLDGLGVVTTFGMIAEIGELERFRSCRRLNSYTGIVPKIHQSDKFYQVGHLSQDCNKHLRCHAVCAAQAATRCKRPSNAKAIYERTKRDDPKRACLAKIAAARKLMIDVYWTWQQAIA
jgi:transposase